MGREDGRHNQHNTGSHAKPSPGHRVLSIAVNPEDYRQLQCGRTTVTQHSIKLQSTAMRWDYSNAAQQHSSSSTDATAAHQQQHISSSREQQYSSTAAASLLAIPRRSSSHKASTSAGFTFQIKDRHPVGRTRRPNPCQRLLEPT